MLQDTQKGKNGVFRDSMSNFFCVEDTHEKCYRDLVSVLLNRGWHQNAFKKSVLSNKKRSKFLLFIPLFHACLDFHLKVILISCGQ